MTRVFSPSRPASDELEPLERDSCSLRDREPEWDDDPESDDELRCCCCCSLLDEPECEDRPECERCCSLLDREPECDEEPDIDDDPVREETCCSILESTKLSNCSFWLSDNEEPNTEDTDCSSCCSLLADRDEEPECDELECCCS